VNTLADCTANASLLVF